MSTLNEQQIRDAADLFNVQHDFSRGSLQAGTPCKVVTSEAWNGHARHGIILHPQGMATTIVDPGTGVTYWVTSPAAELDKIQSELVGFSPVCTDGYIAHLTAIVDDLLTYFIKKETQS